MENQSRRRFMATGLNSLPLISLAPTIPGFLARTARAAAPEKDRRVLVVIQLDGGNDGINTVVPFRDEGYAKHRDELRLPANRLLKINESVGLHPAMIGASKLLESGRLAIVQGVGYPNPDRSHFASMAIWQTARRDPLEHSGLGWLGRGLDVDSMGSGAGMAVHIGPGAPPVALRGRRSATTSLEHLDDLTLDSAAIATPALARRGQHGRDDLADFVRRSALDAYTTADRMAGLARSKPVDGGYPATALGRKLALVAQLLKGGFKARVFYTAQSGYDTHAAQAPIHESLLAELSGALLAFLDDLTRAKQADRVTVLCFSEFGRRVAENGSAGTDHGTAGPIILAGPGLKPGLVGANPNLCDVDDGDVKMSVDFRRVYAAVLKDWLGLPTDAALGGAFDPLALFRS
jgi:uncharacterized protein (DUF1501 family)